MIKACIRKKSMIIIVYPTSQPVNCIQSSWISKFFSISPPVSPFLISLNSMLSHFKFSHICTHSSLVNFSRIFARLNHKNILSQVSSLWVWTQEAPCGLREAHVRATCHDLQSVSRDTCMLNLPIILLPGGFTVPLPLLFVLRLLSFILCLRGNKYPPKVDTPQICTILLIFPVIMKGSLDAKLYENLTLKVHIYGEDAHRASK